MPRALDPPPQAGHQQEGEWRWFYESILYLVRLSCLLHCQPASLLILFTSGLAHSLLSAPLVFPVDPLVCFLAQQSWCEEEERLLVLTHQEVGNKWSEIARRLPGR